MILFLTVESKNLVFGLFENNLVNWLLLVAAILWLWAKYMPQAFNRRQEDIERTLSDALASKSEGEAFLAMQKAKVENAGKEADQILIDAKALASEMKAQMDAETETAMGELTRKIDQHLANERRLAISELRSASAKAAVKLTEAILPSILNTDTRSRLLDQFVRELEAPGSK